MKAVLISNSDKISTELYGNMLRMHEKQILEYVIVIYVSGGLFQWLVLYHFRFFVGLFTLGLNLFVFLFQQLFVSHSSFLSHLRYSVTIIKRSLTGVITVID